MSLEIRNYRTGESNLIADFIRRLQVADGQDDVGVRIFETFYMNLAMGEGSLAGP